MRFIARECSRNHRQRYVSRVQYFALFFQVFPHRVLNLLPIRPNPLKRIAALRLVFTGDPFLSIRRHCFAIAATHAVVGNAKKHWTLSSVLPNELRFGKGNGTKLIRREQRANNFLMRRDNEDGNKTKTDEKTFSQIIH